MQGHDLIVVGTSAGGLDALQQLVRSLPANLPASVCIVQHMAADGPDLLAGLLNRSGPLPATSCRDGMPIEHGQVAVAPPDSHLLVEEGRLRLSRGPRENRHRPSIDVLFRSAAVAYGSRVIGVILTGRLDDGTAGLLAIKQCGGIAVVQDPQDSLYPSMPQSALRHVAVDFTVPIAELAVLLAELVSQPVEEDAAPAIPQALKQEVHIAAMDKLYLHTHDNSWTPSVYSCPDCGGVLDEQQDGSLLRFRCQVGHALSMESLLAEQPEMLERTLWAALKTLRERAHLVQRLYAQAERNGLAKLSKDYEDILQETHEHILYLERILQRGDLEKGAV